ncbi:hypothetical protein [Thioalkalivibrio sp. XN8]|uniref:hypothetical protein n=1 Tax=Thioalkalivibrio sp. XN8 TaxID=2712863 RepID=UPI0013EA23F0|nr:hypothetical protein [Thioalkalivibrio sp. XN8]NGP52763.1 hypothetical protein [Thioalkalivibrio sp. XN8]
MNSLLRTCAMLLACAAAATLAAPAYGQVVREADVRSLAGVLDPVANTADDFIFASSGREVLFADLDSEIFQVQGRRGGDHGDEHETAIAASSSGGSSHEDGSSHEEGDGCGGAGGPGGLCLQVIDAAGTIICWADRPLRPGWQRDPALACPLPDYGSRRPEQYTLRVSLKTGGCGPGGSGGHDHEVGLATASAPTGGDATPYVLNWSLRRIARDGRLANQAVRQD